MMLRSVMKTKILEKHKTYNSFKFFNSLLFVYYEVDEYTFFDILHSSLSVEDELHSW